LLQQIAAGEVDIVVGTQAIIQDDVSFNKLALVVIDEQHKFGRHAAGDIEIRRAGSALSGDDCHAHSSDRRH